MTLTPHLRRIRYRRTYANGTELREVPPAEGQIAVLIQRDPDGFDETTWFLRFRRDISIWEFGGGMKLQDEVSIEEQVSGVAYVDAATIGPLFQPAIGGLFFFMYGATMGYRGELTHEVTWLVFHDTLISGMAIVFPAVNAEISTGTGDARWGSDRDLAWARLQYSTANEHPGFFSKRWLYVTPVYLIHYSILT
jgi:hypothetical protein